MTAYFSNHFAVPLSKVSACRKSYSGVGQYFELLGNASVLVDMGDMAYKDSGETACVLKIDEFIMILL